MSERIINIKDIIIKWVQYYFLLSLFTGLIYWYVWLLVINLNQLIRKVFMASALHYILNCKVIEIRHCVNFANHYFQLIIYHTSILFIISREQKRAKSNKKVKTANWEHFLYQMGFSFRFLFSLFVNKKQAC